MKIFQLLIFPPNEIPARQTFWKLDKYTFPHLSYLNYFPFIYIGFNY